MASINTSLTRKVLFGLNCSGLDRLYQQIGDELGVILTLHHVRPDAVPEFAPNAHLSITPQFLDTVINLLKRRGFEIVSLDEARQRILSPKRQSRFAAFTLDDGYRDNLQHAVPVLQLHNVPYTIYFATGLMEGTADLWWEAIEALVRDNDSIAWRPNGRLIELPCASSDEKQRAFDTLLHHMTVDIAEKEQREHLRELCSDHGVDPGAILKREMMTWDDFQRVAADPLCTVGAHSANHYALARLEEDEARSEIIAGMDVLEDKLGKRPNHLAYPYGYPAAAGEREFRIAREIGFDTAVTTRPGLVFREHSAHMTALPRVSINGHFQSVRYMSPLTTGLPTRLKARFAKLDVA